jgi:N12 class adenine-specific DNA methylase
MNGATPRLLTEREQIEANLNALKIAYGSATGLDDAAVDPAMKQYGHFGALAAVFDESNDRHADARDTLLHVVGDRDYAGLRASVLNAYYTPHWLVESIWRALERAGFDGGLALEPAAGSGRLMDAPGKLTGRMKWTAIETCAASARVLARRHPDARVLTTAFEKTSIVYDQYDLAILNPPFGSETCDDAFDRDLSLLSIHNLFMAKSVRCVRPGGLIVALVSRWFMDGEGVRVRELVGQHAKLVGGVRLPAGLFPGTDVVTDLLCFKRLDVGDTGNLPLWRDTAVWGDGQDVHVNQWFHDAPERVLGRTSIGPDRYGKPTLSVDAPNDLPARVEKALADWPVGIYASPHVIHDDEYCEEIVVEDEGRTLLYGLALDTQGRPVQRGTDNAGKRRFRRVELPRSKIDRLRGLLAIRDLLKDLIRLEQSESAVETAIEGLRACLNATYRAFVKRFGAIHGAGNSPFRGDPDFGVLLSLELDYDPGVGQSAAKKAGVEPRLPTWQPADILSQRVIRPNVPMGLPENPEDAIVQSMRRFGQVRPQWMAQALGVDETAMLDGLEGRIFHDPRSRQWQIREHYLSGNVRAKLRVAVEASAADERYQVNVAALEGALPEDIPAADIICPIGAPWLPGEVLADFVSYLIDVKMAVAPVLAAGTWYIALDDWQGNHGLTRVKYGTKARSFADIFNRLCNNQPLTVTIEDDDGRRIPDIDATSEVETRAEEIREQWVDWLFADPVRRDRLVRLYNETFNNYVPINVDGRVLVDADGRLPGQADGIRLEGHQLDAVYRAVLDGNLLMDMAVGTGKTFSAVAAVMEMRRMGVLTGKAMVVVPNHLVVQWRSECARLYPQMRVIAAGKRDLEKLNRRAFFAQVAANDCDLVIMPRSAFTFLSPPADCETALLSEQIEELEVALGLFETQDRRTVRRIERRKKQLKTKLERLVKRPRRDTALAFEDLGVELLLSDEQQDYKNLAFTTNLNNVGGMGPPEGSQRAFDAWAKARYLQDKHDGRGFISLTGTPVANSVLELWTMFRFHAYTDLKASGLQWLDAWIALHAEPGSAYEMGIDGKYKQKTRLRAYHNLPELLRAYNHIAHTVTKRDLKAQYRAEGRRWPEPPLKGDRPTLVVCSRTTEQDEYFEGTILARAENMGNVPPEEDNWLKLTSDALLASLDMRLIDPALPDDPDNKVNRAAAEIIERYHRWSSVRGTQLVFCDSGVPHTGRAGFCVYDDLKSKLVAGGVTETEIAYIHDANTEARKQALYDAMNRGDVRVLIASTAKAGAGTNVQRLLVAEHMLDLPWRPADAEQRIGRILRRGNALYDQDPDGFEVEVLMYATDRTLDAVRYATVERKARFIEQLRTGSVNERVIADSDDAVVTSFGEMKARISGNPLIELQHRTEQAVRQLERRERAWRRRIDQADAYIAANSDYAQRCATRLARLAQDEVTAAAYGNELVLETGGDRFAGPGFQKGLLAAVNSAMSQNEWRLRTGIVIGRVCGLELMVFRRAGEVEFTLTGAEYQGATWFTEGRAITLTGLSKRLVNLLAAMGGRAQEIQRHADQVGQELAIMCEAREQPFADAAVLKRQRQLLIALDRALAKGLTALPDEDRFLLGDPVAEAEDQQAPGCVCDSVSPMPAVARPPVFATPGSDIFVRAA